MKRRRFIQQTMMAAAATTIPTFTFAQGMTVQAVIDIIMKDLGGTIAKGSVDTIKIGKPETVVTGIQTV